MFERLDFCTALVAILLLHLVQFVLHHLLAQFGVVEYRLQISNLALQFLIFSMQLIHTQSGQLRESHVYDSLRLYFVQVETLLQVALSIARSLRSTYDVHHLVDVVAGDDESFKNVGTFLCLLQVKLGAAYSHIVTMLHEVLHTFLQRQQTWASLHQSDTVHRERRLHCSHLIQLVEDYIGIGIALHVYYDTHTLTSRLVVNVRYASNLALLHEVGNASHEVGLVYAVRNLSDDNLVVRVAAFDFRLGTHHDASASSLVSLLHTRQTIDISTRREVRSLDILHQSVYVDVRIVDICTASVNHLTQVVCRNIGGHTHGNTVTAVHQEVRYLCRHHRRLHKGVVKVRLHVYSVLLQVVHNVLTHLRESTLRITHGSRRVAVHRAEVTLTVYEHVSHIPVLTHTHQCTVNRRVAMRVILTQHLTYYAGTFLVRVRACVSYAKHSV